MTRLAIATLLAAIAAVIVVQRAIERRWDALMEDPSEVDEDRDWLGEWPPGTWHGVDLGTGPDRTVHHLRIRQGAHT